MKDEDSKLFHDYVKDVTPLGHDKIVHQRQRPKVKPKKQVTEEIILTDNFTDITAEEVLFFARSGLQTKLIRKLKRGQFPIEASLDLHQLTVAEAKQALIEFLFNCKQQNLRHVCIIHGKGTHAADQKAKLKSAINSWLRQLDDILAFCSAQPKDGGAGAVYVLLKRQRIQE